MFDNSNLYALRKEIVGGITHYFVSFIDGKGEDIDEEINLEIYKEFEKSLRSEWKLAKQAQRHHEYLNFSEEEVFKRMFHKPESIEEVVHRKIIYEQAMKALKSFPKKQQRRFLMYYEEDLTLEQIAEIEGCSFQAVSQTIILAEKEIIKIIL